MKKQLLGIVASAFLAMPFVTVPSAHAQTRAYRVTDAQVQTLLQRIETRTDAYKSSMNTALDQSRYNNTNREDSIYEYITEFENATDSLRQNFSDRRSASADVENVLGRANYIQDFMQRTRLNVTVQNQWRNIYFDLNTLASYYNVSWNRTVGSYPSTNYPGYPNNPNSPSAGYNAPDNEVQSVLNRLEVRTTDYRTAVQRGSRRQ